LRRGLASIAIEAAARLASLLVLLAGILTVDDDSGVKSYALLFLTHCCFFRIAAKSQITSRAVSRSSQSTTFNVNDRFMIFFL
jgi:hypothetical protein